MTIAPFGTLMVFRNVFPLRKDRRPIALSLGSLWIVQPLASCHHRCRGNHGKSLIDGGFRKNRATPSSHPNFHQIFPDITTIQRAIPHDELETPWFLRDLLQLRSWRRSPKNVPRTGGFFFTNRHNCGAREHSPQLDPVMNEFWCGFNPLLKYERSYNPFLFAMSMVKRIPTS